MCKDKSFYLIGYLCREVADDVGLVSSPEGESTFFFEDSEEAVGEGGVRGGEVSCFDHFSLVLE